MTGFLVGNRTDKNYQAPCGGLFLAAIPTASRVVINSAQVRIGERNEMSDTGIPSTEAGQRSSKQPARKGWVRWTDLFPWLPSPLAAAVLVAGVWVGLSAPVQAQGATVDYDADDDGLIEVSSLAQLNAIRWDLAGDGSAENPGYAQAYGLARSDMGCPSRKKGLPVRKTVPISRGLALLAQPSSSPSNGAAP